MEAQSVWQQKPNHSLALFRKDISKREWMINERKYFPNIVRYMVRERYCRTVKVTREFDMKFELNKLCDKRPNVQCWQEAWRISSSPN